jgi:hypothetical protein
MLQGKNKTNIFVISNKMVTSPKDEEVTIFISLFNQTSGRAAPFYFGSQTKQKNGGTMFSFSNKKRSHSIQNDSPTKHTLKVPRETNSTCNLTSL